MDNIVAKSFEYVSNLFNEADSSHLSFHNIQHIKDLLENINEIADASGLQTKEIGLIKVAAVFHDIGWLSGGENHEERSAKIASEFLQNNGVADDDILTISKLIKSTAIEHIPDNLLEEVLKDSDILHLGKKEFNKISQSLRKEKEFFRNKKFSDREWLEKNIEFLSQTNFYTDYARMHYGIGKQRNILKLTLKRDELMEEKETSQKPLVDSDTPAKNEKKDKKDKNAGRGVETMFRNTIRTHVEFSAMADSKANILISVNTLLLTAVAAFLVKSLDTNPHLIIPTIILVVTALSTLVISITVTRPKITSGKFTNEDVQKRNVNLMFFGNFCNMDLKTFEWGMNEMINDSEFLYSNMIRDYFHLGKVLGDKYSKLRLAYSIFMYGMIASVIAFGVAVFLTSHPTNLGV